ncbi:MAG TPA: hypothetical protein VK807_23395 [Gemmatimonadaceae bacterium]|jgi:hypothetical protein|nr:hypothetical protein [Gemmatimonadaceae bacterium]
MTYLEVRITERADSTVNACYVVMPDEETAKIAQQACYEWALRFASFAEAVKESASDRQRPTG